MLCVILVLSGVVSFLSKIVEMLWDGSHDWNVAAERYRFFWNDRLIGWGGDSLGR